MKNNLVAICGSYKCTGIHYHSVKNKDFIIKNVSIHTIDCPDCKNSLRWVPEKNRRHSVKSKKYKPLDEIDYTLNQK